MHATISQASKFLAVVPVATLATKSTSYTPIAEAKLLDLMLAIKNAIRGGKS
jgi:hypothetical protein